MSLHDALVQLIIILIGVIPLRVLNDFGGDVEHRRDEAR